MGQQRTKLITNNHTSHQDLSNFLGPNESLIFLGSNFVLIFWGL